MAQVVLTESALTNLVEIAEYIALDKPRAASKLVEEVIKSTKRLKESPES